jgi:hypothetical protein
MPLPGNIIEGTFKAERMRVIRASAALSKHNP